jgi:hypothetical protein
VGDPAVAQPQAPAVTAEPEREATGADAPAVDHGDAPVGTTATPGPQRASGPDQDADGIADPEDQCPADPEDRDGYQDDDGCPDADNDADGIPDTQDQCPAEPEDRDGHQD